MKQLKHKLRIDYQGAVALIMVIMITALTVSSLVVISMTNVSDIVANYQLSESESVTVNMDACLDDAFRRLASSTAASGTYYVDVGNVTCQYEIDSTITNGLKTVTSTASTTSALGSWYDAVVVQVNVSSSPITISEYKTGITEYGANYACGDGSCNYSEDCGTCAADCGSCVCGNGVQEGPEACDDNNTVTEGCGDGTTQNGRYCNADCTAELDLTEACDDNNTVSEYCGDGTEQNGSYCNADCSAVLNMNEDCDYTGYEFGPDCWTDAVSCKWAYCALSCTSCTAICPGGP